MIIDEHEPYRLRLAPDESGPYRIRRGYQIELHHRDPSKRRIADLIFRLLDPYHSNKAF
jgi:hypothetical protein